MQGDRHVADEVAGRVDRKDIVAARCDRLTLVETIGGDGVGRRRLPAVRHPLGERHLQRLVVVLSFRQAHRHLIPPVRGIRFPCPIREGIIDARRRVVREVDVLLYGLVSRGRVDIVGVEGHDIPELPLHADGRLIAVWHLRRRRGEACRDRAEILALRLQDAACSSVGLGPLNGFVAKSGRPSLSSTGWTWPAQRLVQCACEKPLSPKYWPKPPRTTVRESTA